jgi:hypothetical protein
MLSICTVSGGDPRRLAALLRAFRGVADELVVAVDERVDPEALGAVAALADTLVRYPFAPPVERPFGFVHGLCRGEWVFRVDDDEAPSRALLELLAGPPDELTHVFVPRRWLWGDGYLDDDPWAPDWQLRLVRRGAARFPGVMHVPVHATGPHAFLDAPLYHLDLVLNDREHRAAKAARYDRERPGLRLGGLPLNEAYYLPEARAPRVAPVPPEDLELVRAVREPADAPAQSVTAVRVATREEVDAQWGSRPLAEADYAATLTSGRAPRFAAGEVRELDVTVANLGGAVWPGGREALPEIRISSRWRGIDAEGLRTPLPHDLAPGEKALVPVAVRAPDEPGAHVLVLDVVHEGVRWFGAEAEVPVEVAPRLLAVVLVGQPPGDAAFDERVDAVLAALPSGVEPFLVGPKPTWLRDRFRCEAAEEPPPRADLVRVVPAGTKRQRLRLHLAARTLGRNARG